MKDWEVNKINQIYKELDRLTEENARLKSAGGVLERLQDLEVKIDRLLDNCGCVGDDVKTTKSTAAKKKTK